MDEIENECDRTTKDQQNSGNSQQGVGNAINESFENISE